MYNTKEEKKVKEEKDEERKRGGRRERARRERRERSWQGKTRLLECYKKLYECAYIGVFTTSDHSLTVVSISCLLFQLTYQSSNTGLQSEQVLLGRHQGTTASVSTLCWPILYTLLMWVTWAVFCTYCTQLLRTEKLTKAFFPFPFTACSPYLSWNSQECYHEMFCT